MIQNGALYWEAVRRNVFSTGRFSSRNTYNYVTMHGHGDGHSDKYAKYVQCSSLVTSSHLSILYSPFINSSSPAYIV